MLKIFKRVSLLVLTLTLASNSFAAPNPSQTKGEDTRKVVVKQYKWFGDTPKAKRIRVINPFGSVTSRTTSHDSVELSGSIQLIGETPAIHKIDVRDNKGVTEVIVSYPDGIRNDKGQLTGRFDLGVWIPSWVAIEVETDFGDIKVKRSASNVVAKSNTGKITIGTMGNIDAHSHEGNISIDLYNEKYQQGLKAHSDSGDIKVRLGQNAKVVLDARAKGEIQHNFSEYRKIGVVQQQEGLVATMVPNDSTSQEFDITAPKGKIRLFVAHKPTHNVKDTPRKFFAKQHTKLELNQASSQ